MNPNRKMKTASILLLILISIQNGWSQDRIYLDKNWKESTKENASYYRIIQQKEDSLFYVKDHYINGILQMEGHFLDKEVSIYEGLIHWYDPSGNKSFSQTYSRGIPDGESIQYLSDGSVWGKGTYKNGVPYDGFFYKEFACPETYTTYEEGVKQNELVFYKNSLQIAKIKTFKDRSKTSILNAVIPIKEEVFDKQNNLIATLYYSEKNLSAPESGTQVTFYEQGARVTAIKRKTEYLDGEKNGEEIHYYKDGTLWTKGINKENKKYSGDFLIHPMTKVSYQKGEIVGERITYNNDLEVIARLSYKNGMPFTGTLIERFSKTTYKEGQKVRFEQYADNNFKHLEQLTIYNGIESRTTWYKDDGSVLGNGIGRNGKPFQGFYTKYGDTHSHYKNGKKHGQETYFQSPNKISYKKQYNMGVLVWKETPMIDNKGFYRCSYKNGKPYKGIESSYLYESHYKDGTLIKTIKYQEKNQKINIKKVKEFALNPAGYKTQTNEITYINDIPHKITFKVGNPFEGTYIDYHVLTTYKNGVKQGPYEIYHNSKIVEKGNYDNDQKHGIISYTPLEGSPATCEFVNGKPVNGVVLDYGNKTTYKNGLKNGERVLLKYNGFTEFLNYEKGKKNGTVSVLKGENVITMGEYKNDNPYEGDFFNFETDRIESYVQGLKHGIFTLPTRFLTIEKKYDKGVLMWEESRRIDSDSIVSKGIYKNNAPYTGSFITLISSSWSLDKALITSYTEGLKDGQEQQKQIGKEQTTLKSTPYKKGVKEGGYFNEIKDELPYKVTKIEGTYKNDLPYEGQFLTSKQEGLKILSTYKNGKKEGEEIYTDSYGRYEKLYYSNGKIQNGSMLEKVESDGREFTFVHDYEAGKRTKTSIRSSFLLSKIDIIYTDHGFYFWLYGRNSGLNNVHVEVLFDNLEQTSGVINYTKNKKQIGHFEFSEGSIQKGAFELRESIYDFRSVKTELRDNQLLSTVTFTDNAEWYGEVWRSNKIPELNYKNYFFLMFELPLAPISGDFRTKQYLNSGTLLSEAIIEKGKLKEGILINREKQKGGTFLYGLIQSEKGQPLKDAFKIEGVTFKKMLQELKKINPN